MFIDSDNKELFRKCREIWNKITQLIGTNNAWDFVEINLDDNEFIRAYAHNIQALLKVVVERNL